MSLDGIVEELSTSSRTAKLLPPLSAALAVDYIWLLVDVEGLERRLVELLRAAG